MLTANTTANTTGKDEELALWEAMGELKAVYAHMTEEERRQTVWGIIRGHGGAQNAIKAYQDLLKTMNDPNTPYLAGVVPREGVPCKSVEFDNIKIFYHPLAQECWNFYIARPGAQPSECIDWRAAGIEVLVRGWNRKWDGTGSVLWRASVDLAQAVIQQLEDGQDSALLNRETLKNSHLVELGAGTGLLAVALSQYVQKYTVTDIAELVPLLRKNVDANFPHQADSRLRPADPRPGSNIAVEALDWVLLHSTRPTQRNRVIDLEPADLVLVVDCIYHPSLLPPLVTTLNHLTTSTQTTVLVVVELRQEDVIREFLQLWLESGSWEIWRINGLLSRPYAIWAGRKNEILPL